MTRTSRRWAAMTVGMAEEAQRVRMMMRRWVAGVSASVVHNSSEREGGKERERQKASKRARERVRQTERKR